MRFYPKLKTKHLILSIFLLLVFTFLYLAFSLKSPRVSHPVKAQETVDYQCIGKGVADYMNAIITGAGNLGKIKLLSPEFNMTSRHFNGIVDAMATNHANFAGLAGIAGNAYNFAGKRVTKHVEDAMANGNLKNLGKPVFVGETGKIDFGIPELAEEMGYIKSGSHNGINYIGAALFNAFNTNPSWSSFRLSNSEISTVCGGNCGRKIGVNFATAFSQSYGYYITAEGFGMGFTLEIANTNLDSAIDGIKKAQSRGMTPVIRIGSGTDSGGFKDPNTYINFLKAIDSNPEVKGTIYAIAGPNEPETDTWLTPNCQSLESPLKNAKCNEISDPEFHTLRPYPANPCDLSVRETTYQCSNQFVTKETFKVKPSQGSCEKRSDGSRICTYSMASSIQTSVNLDKAFLPILGNTELVPNGQNPQNNLDFKERINNYVSWYLNGMPTLPEEEDRKDDFTKSSPDIIYRLINLSGPIRKLMPWGIQATKRIETIQEGYDSRNNNAGIRHDQIVGCRIINLVTGDLPTACYHVGSLTLYAMRLTEWLSPINRLFPPDLYLIGGFVSIRNLLPPLEETFPHAQDFIKAYRTWRNNVICSPSIAGLFLCSPKLKSPWWSNLFQGVPFSSTEDRKGTQETKQPPTSKTTGTGDDEIKVTDIKYEPGQTGTQDDEMTKKDVLYFPHMEEAAELSAYLQQTYTPRGQNGNTNTRVESESPTIGPGCTMIETRSNPGDKLYADKSPEAISGTLTYNTQFKCVFPPSEPSQQCILDCVNGGETIDNCTDRCRPSEPTCTKDVFVGIPMEGQTPKIEEIWNRLVEGDFSVFKRIFPKVGEDTPFGKLKDIPAVTNGTYTATGGSGNSTVSAIAGDESAQRPGDSAEIYFPHVGSLHEYFLRGIQTALRPKGFSDLPLSGIVPPGSGTPPTLAPSYSYCGVDDLLPYFGNDPTKAKAASCVCMHESGANEFAENKACLTGGSVDYSVGLFQINMLAHCPEALPSYTWNPPSCKFGNMSKLTDCVTFYKIPDNNIKKAVELSKNGTSWSGPWKNSARLCGVN